MIIEFENQDELVLAFITYGGILNGYIPEEGFDSSKISYPVKIEIDDENNTFRLYKEPVVEKITEVKKKSNKKLILGLSIGIPVSILVIVGIVLAVIFSGCSAKEVKPKCLQYNQHGVCVAEELIYQKRRY